MTVLVTGFPLRGTDEVRRLKKLGCKHSGAE